MLIDKGIAEGDVVTLKLTSGEEVIGKLAEEGPLFIKLNKPMVLTMNQQGIGMAPYLFTVNPDRDVRVFKTTVTVFEPTMKEFADSYLQGTTGIKLA